MSDLSRADIYFMMGLPFERAIVTKAQALHPRSAVCAMTAGVPRRAMSAEERHHDARAAGAPNDDDCGADADPHVWLTPAAMTLMASNTAAALAARDPEGRDFYAARLARMATEMAAFDGKLRAQLKPARGCLLLGYHPSWGVLRRRVWTAAGGDRSRWAAAIRTPVGASDRIGAARKRAAGADGAAL